MVEAIPSLSPSQRQAMGHAVIVLAQRAAIEATKQRLRSQGLKPQHFAYREIVALAEAYLLEHRAELIAEAKAIVDRWHAEGMFGPRGGIRSRPARSVRNVPELRTLTDSQGHEESGNGQ
jgi:hypothetical protein